MFALPISCSRLSLLSAPLYDGVGPGAIVEGAAALSLFIQVVRLGVKLHSVGERQCHVKVDGIFQSLPLIRGTVSMYLMSACQGSREQPLCLSLFFPHRNVAAPGIVTALALLQITFFQIITLLREEACPASEVHSFGKEDTFPPSTSLPSTLSPHYPLWINCS